jgi:hypothetical protein
MYELIIALLFAFTFVATYLVVSHFVLNRAKGRLRDAGRGYDNGERLLPPSDDRKALTAADLSRHHRGE